MGASAFSVTEKKAGSDSGPTNGGPKYYVKSFYVYVKERGKKQQDDDRKGQFTTKKLVGDNGLSCEDAQNPE